MTTRRGRVSSFSAIPPAVARGGDQDIGHDRGLARAAEPAAGLGIVAAQFGQHVGEVLVVDFAHPLEAGELAARDQVEVVDQPGHARIVAVRLARLEGEAFAEAPRADPGGIERLHHGQGALRHGHTRRDRFVEVADHSALRASHEKERLGVAVVVLGRHDQGRREVVSRLDEATPGLLHRPMLIPGDDRLGITPPACLRQPRHVQLECEPAIVVSANFGLAGRDDQVDVSYRALIGDLCLDGDGIVIIDLVAEVLGFIEHWNEHERKGFRWTFRGYPREIERAAA